MARIRLASYNIHGCVGRDGRFAPERIRDVLAEVDGDLVGLQEVGSHTIGFDTLAWLAAERGAEGIAGPTLTRAAGDYGNALLTRHRVLAVRRLDLSVAGQEPRGALDVDLDCAGWRLRVVVTHLGLRPAERRVQIRRILAALGAAPPEPTVLMGDLNEWFLWGRPLRWLRAQFERTPAPRTFPARVPLFALDRIWVRPRHLVRRMATHASPLARVASDHLPLLAEIAQ